jgi:hypothetical protein
MWNGDALRNDEMMLSDDEIREEEIGQLEKERLKTESMASRYPGMRPSYTEAEVLLIDAWRMFQRGGFRIIIEPIPRGGGKDT